MTVQDVLARRAPRRLLALDGGGIRGLITIEVSAKIEAIVRQNTAADAVLADYFDYIAGTSTGAIIAASLSIGMSVAAIRDFYLQTGPAMFDAASWLRRFNYKPS